MDILIGHPLRDDVLTWLKERHEVVYDPRLELEPHRAPQALGEARAVFLPPTIVLDETALRRAGFLRVVGRLVNALGDDAERSACASLGVEVVRGNAASARSEAEFMLGALLTLTRPAPEAHGGALGRELGSISVGLVGMSHAARTLAMMLAALKTRTYGYDPMLHLTDPAWTQWGVEPMGLRDMLEHVDAVCVQLGYFTRYRGLLGDRYLPHCKPGQVWVSVASSALFDPNSLALGLNSGRIHSAWLDACEPEHVIPGGPLHGQEGLIVTPRLAGSTIEAQVRRSWLVARQVHELLSLLPEGSRDFGTSVPGDLLDGTIPVPPAGAAEPPMTLSPDGRVVPARDPASR